MILVGVWIYTLIGSLLLALIRHAVNATIEDKGVPTAFFIGIAFIVCWLPIIIYIIIKDACASK